jgi:oxygen-independent coproporphyrinogen-3 oxidase
MESYAAACVAEVRSVVGADRYATSVFFGGGTPSLLPADLLVSILAAVPLAPGAEVTVECNPETVTAPLLAAYRQAGVNRLSFGVQSMVPSVLAALGRDHDPASVRRAVASARDAGFESFNLDLIYGGAGESIDDWRRSLSEVLELGPPHVSAYALTVEAGTPLARDAARHPDDDDQAAKYELACDLLSAAGLEWYEISNWARPGFECRHNQLYWTQGDYAGIGCAAHSHSYAERRRWWNVRTPERYIAGATGGEEVLTEAEQILEGMQLALRTRSGLAAGSIDPDLSSLRTDRGAPLVEVVGDRAVLTVAGRLLANEVALRLRAPSPAAAAALVGPGGEFGRMEP